MRLKKLLLISGGILLVVGLLSVCLAPFAVAAGLRWWITRTAQQEGLRVEFGRIEAPLLSPVVIHHLQIESRPESPFRVRIGSSRMELALNLSAFFSRGRGHILRNLTTNQISIDLRRNPESTSQFFAWRTLDDLLADNFTLSGLDLHLENGETTVDLRGGVLSGAQIGAGVFSADELTIVSPWFCKNFAYLRGATSWQENRLSIGALTLTRGLDIDSINIDLSQVGESRIGLELNLDAFGGKLRASVSSDDHSGNRTWEVAGTASEISLAQMSEALEFTDGAAGSLHACKFTFRGETTNLLQATATVWAEVTGLTWRDRTADTIIIGASLYHRQVQVEQLYVKQRANQLTLTGESTLPDKLADWLNPDFRGDISASINDLGDLARLFGALPSDFAGKVEISGSVSARERKLGGHLTVSGQSLTVFRVPVESLGIKLGMKESALEISNFELCRKNDFARGQGTMDLASGGSYSGKFTISIAEAADYVDLLPEGLRGLPIGGNLNLDWVASGTEAGHSGTVQVRGHALHIPGTTVIPFRAELEAEYSPSHIYFRRFNLANPHASLSTFLTVAKDYAQVQSLRFDLNGNTKLQGNVFLPVSFSRLQSSGNWLAALNENPVFDVDVTLDPTDLTELGRALVIQPTLSGQVSGSLQASGPLAALDGKAAFYLHNFVSGNEPRISTNLEMRSEPTGLFQGKANAVALASAPVGFDWSIPYRFERQGASYAFKSEAPSSVVARFPAVSISKLPSYISRGIFVDGILSGQLTLSNLFAHPDLIGDVQLINGRFLGGMALSSKITWQGRTGTIDFARLTRNHIQYGGRGELHFREPSEITAWIRPNTPMVMLTPLEPGDCINRVEFSSGGTPLDGTAPFARSGTRRERIAEIGFSGSLFSPDWTISLSEKHLDDPLEALLQGTSTKTCSLCQSRDAPGKTLTLGVALPPFP